MEHARRERFLEILRKSWFVCSPESQRIIFASLLSSLPQPQADLDTGQVCIGQEPGFVEEHWGPRKSQM